MGLRDWRKCIIFVGGNRCAAYVGDRFIEQRFKAGFLSSSFMTTIFLVPDREGRAFLAPAEVDASFMDVAVVDTLGLVRYAEEMLGVHRRDEAFNVRLCRYYKLVRKWLDAHPDNVLNDSFRLAHLSTARQMLLWRDELRMAQWDFRCDDCGTRLGALAAIEWMERVPGLPDRMIDVVGILEASGTRRFSDLRILLNVERGVLRPLLRRLLDALERNGAEIGMVDFAAEKDNNLSAVRNMLLSGQNKKIALNVQDESLEVVPFETAYDQAEYIAVCQHDLNATLIINPRAKETDNRLTARNLPTSGSEITSRSRILNMMSLALSLYDNCLQITKLVEWFTAPVHPLPGRFRFQLAEAIARSGGFLNRDCRGIVDKYIAGEYEYPHERDKDLSESELRKVQERRRQSREENVRLFVPYLTPGYRTGHNAERTLTQLSVWARQRVHSLDDDDNREAVAIQLNALADSIEILMLLFSERDEKFDLSLANEWVRDIPVEITLPQHPAQVGSVFTVSSPRDMVSPASRIVWANMENEEATDFDCDFLLPFERESIARTVVFWSREDETRYRFLNSIMPFLFAADSIVLMYANKRGGELIVPHPLITRLKVQVANLNDFIIHKDIRDKRTVTVETVDNGTNASELRFGNADRIKLPTRMSATGLETLTVYPFDFLFERILNYQTAGLSSLPDFRATQGNVAHAAIQRLFSPREGSSGCGADEIRRRISGSYDQALQDSINECGAVFMLPENKLALSNLRHRLLKCIDSLLDIIEANGLTVNGCEIHYSKFVDLYGAGVSGDRDDDLHGYMDMKLSDPAGNHVVFDLKWTGSRTYHRNLLEKNRSTQLAVYSELLGGGDASVATAYFIMPRGRLVSCHPFRGGNVDLVTPMNADDIMAQLINSFRYRRKQLTSGMLEIGERHPIGELTYGKDRLDFNLFPLPEGDDPGCKAENGFSSYRLFKSL